MARRRQRKIEDPIEVSIDSMSHEGRGIAHIDGKTIFISGALLGERVTFNYTSKKTNYDEGHVVSVITPSSDRVPPRCVHFGVCGGCSLQHMSHEAQIAHKQKTIAELIQKETGVAPKQWLAPLISDPWGYRRKARLSVKYVIKKDKVLVGFRERKGRFVADLTECHVLDQSVGSQLEALSTLLMGLEARDTIPQIEVAVGDQATAIILRHLKPLVASDLNALVDFTRKQSWILLLQPDGVDTIHLVEPEGHSPLLNYSLNDYDLSMQFNPSQFIQVNATINNKMLSQAIDLLDLQSTDKVLDLFCGVGNVTLPIARSAAQVVGIEGENAAVEQAKENAKNHLINNCQFYCADLFQSDYNDEWAIVEYDKVVLDPPRAGAKEIIPTLSRWNPTKVVYISCNPATLARDAQLLIQQGYQLDQAGIMDMFSHTQHIEVMALFTKG